MFTLDRLAKLAAMVTCHPDAERPIPCNDADKITLEHDFEYGWHCIMRGANATWVSEFYADPSDAIEELWVHCEKEYIFKQDDQC